MPRSHYIQVINRTYYDLPPDHYCFPLPVLVTGKLDCSIFLSASLPGRQLSWSDWHDHWVPSVTDNSPVLAMKKFLNM